MAACIHLGISHLLFAIWRSCCFLADAVWRMPRVISYPAIVIIAAWGVYAAAYHATEIASSRLTCWCWRCWMRAQPSHYIPLYSIDHSALPDRVYLDSLAKGDPGPFGPASVRGRHGGITDKRAFREFRADSVDEAKESYFWGSMERCRPRLTS